MLVQVGYQQVGLRARQLAERQRSSVPDGCGGRSRCAMVITGDQLLVQVDRQVRERHLAERQRAIEPL